MVSSRPSSKSLKRDGRVSAAHTHHNSHGMECVGSEKKSCCHDNARCTFHRCSRRVLEEGDVCRSGDGPTMKSGVYSTPPMRWNVAVALRRFLVEVGGGVCHKALLTGVTSLVFSVRCSRAGGGREAPVAEVVQLEVDDEAHSSDQTLAAEEHVSLSPSDAPASSSYPPPPPSSPSCKAYRV